jgi:hypothetical protein
MRRPDRRFRDPTPRDASFLPNKLTAGFNAALLFRFDDDDVHTEAGRRSASRLSAMRSATGSGSGSGPLPELKM